MRAAILSSGASLHAYPGATGYDVVIGVNRAVIAHPCKWWSVGDALTVGRYITRLVKTPQIWTHTDTYNTIIGRHGWLNGATYRRDERDARWSMFSATAALWLAHLLGASECDCYGCDMAGTLNFDGTEEPDARRDEQRWELERGIWKQTCERIPEMKVTRHGLDVLSTSI